MITGSVTVEPPRWRQALAVALVVVAPLVLGVTATSWRSAPLIATLMRPADLASFTLIV